MSSTSPVKTRNIPNTIGVWVAAIAAIFAAGAAITTAAIAAAFPGVLDGIGEDDSIQGTICLTYSDFVLDQHHQNGLSAEQIQSVIDHSLDVPSGPTGAEEDAGIDLMCGTPAQVIEAVR